MKNVSKHQLVQTFFYRVGVLLATSAKVNSPQFIPKFSVINIS